MKQKNIEDPGLFLISGLLIILSLLFSACSTQSDPDGLVDRQYSQTSVIPPEAASPFPSITATVVPTLIDTPSRTPTIKPSGTSTKTLTPSITPTPTITLTPTFDFPDATVLQTSHCRYGPGTAYLHAADLYTGDQGQIWTRNYAGTWVWVKFDKLHYACWVAASLVDIQGDIYRVIPYFPPLPKSTFYSPVERVTSERQGDSVIISWDEVWMTEDDFRGYLIEAQVCQNGFFIDVAFHTDKTQMTILDERNCDQVSNGKLYAVEKHGYTDPVSIPWP